MSSKKGIKGLGPYNFWHPECCKCICGCKDPNFFGVAVHGHIVIDFPIVDHLICKYNYNSCIFCGKVIGIETAAKGCHERCITGRRCYICKIDLLDKRSTGLLVKDGLCHERHRRCSDMLCNICMQPMTFESKHNLTYHNKCKSIRFPGICDCTKFMLVNLFTWFDNRVWSPKTHIYTIP